MQFKTKRSTQLKKLMKAYCERQGGACGCVFGGGGVGARLVFLRAHAHQSPFPLPTVVYSHVRFMFDGQRINETNTPEEVSWFWWWWCGVRFFQCLLLP